MRARAGHGVRCALRCERGLGTTLRCAVVCAFRHVLGTACGAGVCGYGRVLGMALRCTVCGCGRVLGTAGGAGGLRGEKTRCAYGRKIGR